MRASLAIITLVSFITTSLLGPMPQALADDFHLPAPGVMVHQSPEFKPPILKGIKVHPDNPFRFDFILDQGDQFNRHPERSERSQQEQLKIEATKLIKYFLASLTIPEKDLWVNLSPYEKNRIIPQSFGLTEMGRDLLAEDYMLKQITASLIYPEDEIGKKFWRRIYEEAEKKFGTTNIPVNTFNKVWIVPDKAVVYENAKAGTAYVVEAKLKVMLEQDYLSLQKHSVIQKSPVILSEAKDLNNVNALGSQIVREIVIPELTKEVNENKNFAQLRQVYNSLILATWYKKKIKDSILEQVYADKNKTAGVQYSSTVIPAQAGIHKSDIEAIYQRYLKAFKTGVYNYIKEDIDPATQETIPRKYFSGGMNCTTLNFAMTTITKLVDPEVLNQRGLIHIVSRFTSALNPKMVPGRREAITGAAAASLAFLPGISKTLIAQSAPQYTEEEKLEISKYIAAFKAGRITFSPYLPGEDAVKQLDFKKGFSNFYDQLRYRVNEKLIKTGQATAEDVGKIADQILVENINISPYQQYGLDGFFKGIWSEYIVASINNQRNISIIAHDLIYQAGQYSDSLVDVVRQMTSLGENPSKYDSERIMEAWQRFNETYMIPNGYYGEINIMENTKSGRNFYFAVIYKVEKKEQRKVNGSFVTIVYGRKIDRVNTKSAAAAHSNKGQRIVFVDLEDMDSEVLKIMQTLEGHPYLLIEGQPNLTRLISEKIRELFKGMSEKQIREYVLHSTRGHEFFHQSQDMLGYRYKGTDHFGFPEGIWENITSESKESIDHETGAMLSQFITVQDPRSELVSMLRLILPGQNTPYYFGARWILNRLDGRPIAQWTDWQDPKGLAEQLIRLWNMEPEKLRHRTEELMKDSWSEELLTSVKEADSAQLSVPRANPDRAMQTNRREFVTFIAAAVAGTGMGRDLFAQEAKPSPVTGDDPTLLVQAEGDDMQAMRYFWRKYKKGDLDGGLTDLFHQALGTIRVDPQQVKDIFFNNEDIEGQELMAEMLEMRNSYVANAIDSIDQEELFSALEKKNPMAVKFLIVIALNDNFKFSGRYLNLCAKILGSTKFPDQIYSVTGAVLVDIFADPNSSGEVKETVRKLFEGSYFKHMKSIAEGMENSQALVNVVRKAIDAIVSDNTHEITKRLSDEFGLSPQRILYFLTVPAVVAPFFEAGKRIGRKVDYNFLVGAAFSEGYIIFARSIIYDNESFSRGIDNWSIMGLDSFLDQLGILKDDGLLPDDYDGFIPDGGEFRSEGGAAFKKGNFKDLPSLLEAFEGLLDLYQRRYVHAVQASRDKVDLKELTTDQVRTGAYSDYVSRDFKEVFDQYGPLFKGKAKGKGPGHPISRGSTAAATAKLLEQLGIFNTVDQAMQTFTRMQFIRIVTAATVVGAVAPDLIAQPDADVLLQDFRRKWGDVVVERIKSILDDGQLEEGLKRRIDRLDSLASEIKEMKEENFRLFVETMGFKNQRALLLEFIPIPKQQTFDLGGINFRDIMRLFEYTNIAVLREKIEVFERLFVGTEGKKIAYRYPDILYNFFQNSSAQDLDFYEQVIQEFPDLLNPTLKNPADNVPSYFKEKKDALMQKIKDLPPFHTVDMAKGEVDNTAKNIEMKYNLRRYFLSLLQFYQFMAPIDEDNRIKALGRSLFAFITNEDEGVQATYDGHVGYKIIQEDFLKPVLAHEQGHNASYFGLGSNVVLNEFVGDLYADLFEQASGEVYGYNQKISEYQRKVNSKFAIGRAAVILIQRRDPMHDEHFYARLQKKNMDDALRKLEESGKVGPIDRQAMFFAFHDIEDDYKKGKLKNNPELTGFLEYSFESNMPFNFGDFIVELLKRYFQKIGKPMPDVIYKTGTMKTQDGIKIPVKWFEGFKLDKAMGNTGGIDLTPANMHVQTQNAGQAIKFHLNPAMLAQLENAPGFVPVIIDIEPLGDLRQFLGIQE